MLDVGWRDGQGRAGKCPAWSPEAAVVPGEVVPDAESRDGGRERELLPAGLWLAESLGSAGCGWPGRWAAALWFAGNVRPGGLWCSAGRAWEFVVRGVSGLCSLGSRGRLSRLGSGA